MDWVVAIIIIFFVGIFVHIQKRLSEIIERIDDIENAISDFENEFQDRFPRNDEINLP